MQKPGAYGLVMANVGLVYREAVGLFSTERPNKPSMRADSDAIQREIDAQTKVRFTEAPQGDATIETYAVLHGRTVPKAACCSGAWLLRASASSRTRPPMRQRSRSWSRSKASGCPAP